MSGCVGQKKEILMLRFLALVALACTFGVATGQQAGTAAAQKKINLIQNQGNTEYKAPRALEAGTAAAASKINKIQGPIEKEPARDIKGSSVSYEKGKTAFNKKDYKAAIDHFTRAIDQDHKNADAYSTRGRAYGFIGEHFNAVSDFTKALYAIETSKHYIKEKDPREADCYAFRAKSYSLVKKYAESVADCDKAIDLGVMGSSIHNLRKLSAQAMVNAK